jgi:radical SAM superfamily enzyme YgiQ (UPF0313 family)
MNTFELGPIRPPSEAGSILLRVTRNCPWNRCAFCHTYQGETFSRRSVEDVLSDIDLIADAAEKIIFSLKENRERIFTRENSYDLAREMDMPEGLVRQVAFWVYHGMGSLFLQDADCMVVKTDDMVRILNHAVKRFPSLERITGYSRSRSAAKKSLEEMRSLREAGLSRVHMGMESGADPVLDLVKKGARSRDIIDAGQKIVEAGMELSLYFIPGLGGEEYSELHARESARVCSRVNPDFIRLRSAVPLPDTGLHELMEEGTWKPLPEIEKVREIRLFIQELEGGTSTLASDHIINLLEEVEGKLPEERERMLGILDRFLSMPEEDQELFILGRRMGRFRRLDDLVPDPELRRIRQLVRERYPSLDAAVLEMMWNYI